MKLRRGRAQYKFPECSQIYSAWVEGNQKHNQEVSYVLYQVELSDLGAFRKNKLLGRPTSFAVFDGRVEFWPVPDKPYVVKVRYAPPIKEY